MYFADEAISDMLEIASSAQTTSLLATTYKR